MKITWIGHSCFKVEEAGYRIVFDPYDDGYVPGLGPVRETAEEVLCSHEHGDHNARKRVRFPEPSQLLETSRFPEASHLSPLLRSRPITILRKVPCAAAIQSIFSAVPASGSPTLATLAANFLQTSLLSSKTWTLP